jgi:hypothetical protein
LNETHEPFPEPIWEEPSIATYAHLWDGIETLSGEQDSGTERAEV